MENELKTMKDLKPGDYVLGPNSKPVRVNEVFEEHVPERMYEIELENGEKIESSGNHYWYCETDTDRKNKKSFIRKAKRFFKTHNLPLKSELGPAYPINLIPSHFSTTKEGQEFIVLACEALGPSGTTPHEIYDGYLEKTDEVLVYLYSFNDLIDFLEQMKGVLLNKDKGYLYFGKVRTTDEIFSIMDEKINIPEKGDL